MKANRGIALIASLLIMAAIMALGLGSMFLTEMNLKIAENTRSNSVAKNHADAGLDTAIVLLSKIHKDSKMFPAEGVFVLPVTSGQSYVMLPGQEGYRLDSNNQVRIRVEGFTANNARYLAEALLVTEPTINPAFLYGLASPGTIRLNGFGSNVQIRNARIHGNTGVVINGANDPNVFRHCETATQAFSECTVVNPVPVSSSNGTTCSISGCNNQADPIEVDPAYILKRNDEMAKAFGFVDPQGSPLYFINTNGQLEPDGRGGFLYAHPSNPGTSININREDNANIYNGRCTHIYSGTTDFATVPQPGSVICVGGNGSINFPANVNMTNVTVIADGNITFGGAATVNGSAGNLTDVRLISRTKLGLSGNPTGAAIFEGKGGVMLDHVTGHNLAIFSGANRNVNNALTASQPPHYLVGNGFKLTGFTTIASNRDVIFEGQTQLAQVDGKDTVTTAIISSRQITSNTGATDFYGVFWAGTCLHKKGTGTIFGSVVVHESGCQGNTAIQLDGGGNFILNSFYDVSNPSLNGPPEVTVMSRR